nr:fibrinogen C domain-containing protein 1-like isoform X24 [Syngnathus scovelli]XP_049606096.1 fibrinogen C domain-containing protein 1-like isoform X25 [Syngnathus scovelli]XP_049606097.1 fibrinogen C domain-containing protein 1-like isoform X26 [Syngnathus scovelli]XP_049606098.1 fibrinogen C domain-containing protein 1-like isoform X27 [Syngnathus scovelli]
MELQNMQDRSATTDDGVSGGASLPVAVGQSETRLGLPFQRPSNRRQDTTPWWRLFVQIRCGSILVVVPTLLLVVLVIQNIVFFHLNRPQDIVKELGALVATLPNSIPDHNCSDLACHWAALQTALAKLMAGQEALAELKAGQEAGQTALTELKAGQMALGELKAGQEAGQTALAELKAGQEAGQTVLAELKAGQTALAELKAGQEAGQTALAELKAGQEAGQTALAELKAGQTVLAELKASHTAIRSDLEASQSLLAKVWEEIRSNKGLLNETLKDLETDYKNMSQELSQETKELHNFSLALSSLQQKVVDQLTLSKQLQGLMPRDCSDVMAAGKSRSGVHSIFSGSDSFEAYCNMSLDGGGWTVIQRRKDGSVDFYRGWDDYRKGFGDLAGEHWLGLQNIHALTASGAYQLRIDLTLFDGRNYYALYDDFSVGRNSLDPEKDGYPLLVSGYSGNAGDKLAWHSGMKFTTKDRDQDEYHDRNCANDYKGAWWYKSCYYSNLNGVYKATGTCVSTNAVWNDLGHSYDTCPRFVEMKIRPRK